MTRVERAERIAANYREMHGFAEPDPLSEFAVLERMAAMMGEFVDNWPQPKRFETALALIAKTLRASSSAHDLYAACYAAYQRIDGERYPDLIGPLHAALVKASASHEPELHTITWSVKRMRELKAAHLETFTALERAFVFICNNMPLGPTNDRTMAGKLIDSLRVPLATARDICKPDEQEAA